MKNTHYGKNRLADMDMAREVEYYSKPEEASIRDDLRIDLDVGSSVYIQTWELRGRVVWFVIEQQYQMTPGSERITIARIDCCIGKVHEHRYNRAGVDVLDHREIFPLRVDEPPEVVDSAYIAAYDYALEMVERNLKWWRNSADT